MSLHVIVGSGPVGSATARQLLASGVRVRMVTRRGTAVAGAEGVAADASDTSRMRELAEGADVLYKYLGPGAVMWTMLVLPRLLAGKSAFVPADLDAAHTWTNPIDVARLLVAAAADPDAWGQAWHVPSAEPRSIRQLNNDAVRVAGAQPAGRRGTTCSRSHDACHRPATARGLTAVHA
jgi:nucleoside-diphosphate-sugar epimerase